MLSKIIANLFPTLFVVILPNFFVPTLSNEKLTIVSLLSLSNLGIALVKFSPLRTTLLLTLSSEIPSSKNKVSLPKFSFSFDVNLKVKLAVFPSKFLIRFGSSNPGNSIKILSHYLCEQ